MLGIVFHILCVAPGDPTWEWQYGLVQRPTFYFYWSSLCHSKVRNHIQEMLGFIPMSSCTTNSDNGAEYPRSKWLLSFHLLSWRYTDNHASFAVSQTRRYEWVCHETSDLSQGCGIQKLKKFGDYRNGRNLEIQKNSDRDSTVLLVKKFKFG
jgi:hypothetical protein